jgi:MFS transporter, OFA family, oxalate/formate antiporter
MRSFNPEFRFGWKILVVAIVGVFCGASPLTFNTIPQFIGPLRAEYGWSFKEISSGLTIFGVLASLLAPLFGFWADKYGARRVAIWSLFAFGVAFGALGFTQGLNSYFFIWFMIGLVGIGSTPVVWSRTINLWFARSRGLALGILLLGTSFAAILLPLLTNALIHGIGWRRAFFVLALFPVAVALPLAWRFFRDPAPHEIPIAMAEQGGVAAGQTLGEALRNWRFWLIFISVFLVMMAYSGSHIHMKEILKLKGYSDSQAAGMFSIIGFSILAGRLITGFLFDRFWAPAIAAAALALPAISCWILFHEHNSFALTALALVLLGFAAGAESDMLAFMAGRYFGMRNYGKIYGALYMAFGMASAFSPLVYGAVRDATGNYNLMLKACVGLFLAGAAMMLLLGRYPNFNKSGQEW